MALTNPRGEVAFDEIDARYATYKIDNSTIVYSATITKGSAVVDRAVKLSTDDTVALCADGDPVWGRLEKVEADGKCSVQIRGHCKLPGGNSATLTVGAKIIGAVDGSSNPGFIKAVPETVTASPTQAEVQNAFKAARTRGMIVNNNTPTAVVVDLG